MKAVEFTCTVENGRLPPRIGQTIGDIIRRMDGRRLVIRLSQERKRRSTRQNAFYFDVVLGQVADWHRTARGLAVTNAQVHDWLMKAVGGFGSVYLGLDGVEHESRRSSADLSPAEWEEYVEKVRAWAATECGLSVRRPNEPATEILY